MKDARRGMLLMIAFVALWAAVEALAAHVLLAYSPYQVVWIRYAVHLLLMFAVWGWREPMSLVRTRRVGFQLARSLLMLAMPASWIMASRQGMQMGTVMAIFWLSPLMMLGIGAVALRETASIRTWCIAALASTGAIAYSGPESSGVAAGLVLPVCMALSFSAYVVMTRSLRTETMRANLFYTAFGVLLALSPFMPEAWVSPNLHDWVVLVGVGLIGFAALQALDRSMAAAKVCEVAPVSALQPVFITGIATALGNGQLNVKAFTGLMMISIAAILAWRILPGLNVEKTT
jgi:drug/metabolite transporter (DMT)-like permease